MWGQIIGAAIGAGASLLGASQQNKAAKEAAQTQMDFQERMANTAYQRSMADMRAAGLNPILAYKQGGADTPSGSTYSPVNVGAAATTGGVQGASTALQARRLETELEAMKAGIENTKEDTTLKRSQGWTADNQGALYVRQNEMLSKQMEMLNEQIKQTKADTASAASAEAFFKSPWGKIARWLDLTGKSVNPFATSASQIRRGIGGK